MGPTGESAVRRPGTPSIAPARLVRGGVVGLVSGLGASVAHQVAGGHVAPVVTVVVTFLSVAIGVAVARRRIGVVESLALAVVAQAASHLLMVSGAHAHGTSVHDAPTMLLPHAVVALATAALSHRCDRVLLRAVDALVAWFVPRAAAAHPVGPTARPLGLRTSVRTYRSRIGYGQVNRRGPPPGRRFHLVA